jgi:hypothetical protein
MHVLNGIVKLCYVENFEKNGGMKLEGGGVAGQTHGSLSNCEVPCFAGH